MNVAKCASSWAERNEDMGVNTAAKVTRIFAPPEVFRSGVKHKLTPPPPHASMSEQVRVMEHALGLEIGQGFIGGAKDARRGFGDER